MLYFHADLVGPEILRRWHPTVIEIGVQEGLHARALLDACGMRRGRFIGIDPLPGDSIKEFIAACPHADLIEAPSLDALRGLIGQGVTGDVIVVDGDHNYFTVSNELALVEGLLSSGGVVYLHDVGWPYGRRDMYYAPRRIPLNARHRYARRGMISGQSALAETGGTNPHLCNATEEGGPRNGGLTAVEDFLAQSGNTWQCEIHQEQNGLAILRRC
jgi:hypothetical protein